MFEKSFQSKVSPGEIVIKIRMDVGAPTPSYGIQGVKDGAGGERGLSALALHVAALLAIF